MAKAEEKLKLGKEEGAFERRPLSLSFFLSLPAMCSSTTSIHVSLPFCLPKNGEVLPSTICMLLLPRFIWHLFLKGGRRKGEDALKKGEKSGCREEKERGESYIRQHKE